ncbi:putative tRNA pseudouridine synthase Pus10 [Actinia tenebrosa]|uniref:tRNA pseudouridine(55) synthase n=1 Tax=Actinia tenebrosa TaxID=6105 RepID=A0A6P8I0C2_ACTTE|nr:putative tRNA pseudouridine synthase Pus10 [Actinia tenebrosa]
MDGNVCSVVATLHELRLCARCILRFIDERKSSSYEESYKNVQGLVSEKYGIEFKSRTNEDENSNGMEVIDDDKTNDKQKTEECAHICPSCLGILQEQCDGTVIKQIEEEVTNSGFEIESFTFSVSLPLCTLVRQHSIFLHLKEKFSDFYSGKTSVDNLPSIKEVFKWVCGPALGLMLGVFFQHESSFQILIKFAYDNGNEELEFLTEVDPSRFKERKAKKRAPVIPLFSVTSIRKALCDLQTAKQLRKYAYCPPSFARYKSYCAEVICSHSSILLAGRYNKYSRTLPQTPWIIDGERMLESSVQEKICDILLSKVQADDCKFSSGGREDIDVRMLGTGRPFVAELINPHKTILSKEFLAHTQKEINLSTTDVKIRHLQVVTKEEYSTLKEAENTKTKTYSCLVWTEKEISEKDLEKLTEIKDLKLQQKTPLRVLHRRPLAVREKVIHSMSTEWKDCHHFTLYLKTMAGTYVKEFVHGDFGRTKPNIGCLLNLEADILELDVESVDVNWPPPLDPSPEALPSSD